MHPRRNTSFKSSWWRSTAISGGLLILMAALTCAWRACGAPKRDVSDPTRFHAHAVNQRIEITTTFEDGAEAAFMPYDLIADYPEGPSRCKVPEIAFYSNHERRSDSPTSTTRTRLVTGADCVIIAPIPPTTPSVVTDEHGRLLLELQEGAPSMYVLPADMILSEEAFYPGTQRRRWGGGPVYPAIRGDIWEHLRRLAADHRMERTPWRLEVTLPEETPYVTIVGMTAFCSHANVRVSLGVSIKGREHTRTIGLGGDRDAKPSIGLVGVTLPVSPDPIRIPLPIIGRGPSRNPVGYGEMIDIRIMVTGESFSRTIYKGSEELRPECLLSVDVAPLAKGLR